MMAAQPKLTQPSLRHLTKTQSTSASAIMEKTRLNCSPTAFSIAANKPILGANCPGTVCLVFSDTRCSYSEIGRDGAGVIGGLGSCGVLACLVRSILRCLTDLEDDGWACCVFGIADDWVSTIRGYGCCPGRSEMGWWMVDAGRG